MPKFQISATLFTAKSVGYFLEALVQSNMDEVRSNPHLPDLYESGVRYMRERDGVNKWQGILESYALRVADCEDLAAARVAILRVRHREPKARCDVKFVREGLWHVRVVRANGAIEDPSAVLGMGQPTD